MAPERTLAPSAPQPPTRERLQSRWARWSSGTALWDGFAALTVGVPALVAVAEAPSPAHAAGTLALVVGFAVWHWLTAVRHPAWDERTPMLLWLAGVLVFTWALLGRHAGFLFMIYGLYPQLFGRLGRWSAPSVVGLTVLVAWRTEAFAVDDPAALASLGGTVLLALLIGFFVTALVKQTNAREEALAALEAARAELAAAERRAGMLAERERLARDLHDTIAQGFTGILMQLEAAEQALEADPGTAGEHLDRARRSARDSLGELRRAVHAMRPRVLDEGDLAQALERTADRWSEETGIAATAATAGAAGPLHPEAEVALLRTAQEGLANVAKHARAQHAALELRYDPERVVLTVADDGAGFAPGDRGAGVGLGAARGAGLDGLARRLEELGGGLTVDSAPGRGTTLVAEVPVR